MLVVDEFLLSLNILLFGLFLQVVGHLDTSLSLFLTLLLLCDGQFLVSELPELCEFHLFLFDVCDFFVFTVDLDLSTLLDSRLHY